MANPGVKRSTKEWDKHCLEQRLSVLEEKHRGLKRVVLDMAPVEKVKVKEPRSQKRDKRDANDCICPPAITPNGPMTSIDNTRSQRDQAHKSAFIQFNTRIVDAAAGPCEGKAIDLGRILKMDL
ncbi:unnamed protein product, partial [Iphiclides podalirius]